VPTIPSKSHDLADENKKVFDGMEMIRNNRIVIDVLYHERQISIKLFYLYQRLQCTDNYFFKIKFVLFLYLLLSAS
jgi:hypothetical protein